MFGVVSFDEALSLVKPSYKEKVKKIWLDFVEKSGKTFESEPPVEEDFKNFFCFLRHEKKMASSSLWTYYSLIIL